jgi:hypothetical protein
MEPNKMKFWSSCHKQDTVILYGVFTTSPGGKGIAVKKGMEILSFFEVLV